MSASAGTSGNRIRQDVLREKRAEYGEQIVSTLSAQLTVECGRGYDRRNLYHVIRFAEVFPGVSIANALRIRGSKPDRLVVRNS
ncbi:DUF1016 N-terminal domain-containing protein [Singulisphaera rosea]